MRGNDMLCGILTRIILGLFCGICCYFMVKAGILGHLGYIFYYEANMALTDGDFSQFVKTSV